MSGGLPAGSRDAACHNLRLPARRAGVRLAAALLIGVAAAPLAAQDTPPEPTPLPASGTQAPRQIDFEASELSYNNESDTVTARGNVILRSEDRSVRADEVVWFRQTGKIIASGNIRMVDEAGNQLFTDQVELTEEFDTGAMSELLIALRAGGRLAARSAERSADGNAVLTDAAYSACPVTDEDGCATDPSWRVTARRVIYDQKAARVRFEGAMLELFGARILPLPGLAIRTDGRAESGFLVPDVRVTQVNGLELSGEYYWRLADNIDLTLGAYVFSNAAPMASAKWRHLTEKGAYQVTGYATFSDRATDFTGGPSLRHDPRGDFDA
ncbi:MAG: LPS-assembly protein LptD, partial [Porphyrobacter sp.]|nr:LPS-assembly protein LptD [Porphyrobacter sp.]